MLHQLVLVESGGITKSAVAETPPADSNAMSKAHSKTEIPPSRSLLVRNATPLRRMCTRFKLTSVTSTVGWTQPAQRHNHFTSLPMVQQVRADMNVDESKKNQSPSQPAKGQLSIDSIPALIFYLLADLVKRLASSFATTSASRRRISSIERPYHSSVKHCAWRNVL